MKSQENFPVSFAQLIGSVVRHRQLIGRMVKREVIGRYKGSVLGLTWSFLNPLVLLTVYTFVFSVVFKARWNVGSDSKSDFALALFVGMIAHGLLADCVNRSPGLILNHVSYVKKVVFPLEILPWIDMGAALFHSLISLLVWSLFFLFVHKFLHWTALFLPLVFVPLILFSMGLALFLLPRHDSVTAARSGFKLLTTALSLQGLLIRNQCPDELEQLAIPVVTLQ